MHQIILSRSDNDFISPGYRLWHADLRPDDTPLEGLLGFCCKLRSDTSFLGREALVKHKEQGLRKRLAYFTVDELVLKIASLLNKAFCM